VFLVNSRFSLVSATPPSSPAQDWSPDRAPLLPKLRGHFAEFLDHGSLDRLGILYLTTCVGLGYGPQQDSLEAFLGSIGSATSPQRLGIRSQAHARRIYQPRTLHPYPGTTIARAGLPSCVTPSLAYYQIGPPPPPTLPERNTDFGGLASPASTWASHHGYGNINPLSIDYACRPRLRPRLTLGGTAWPRNPWSSGGRDSHPAFATHA
jgi:hypothetical protein